MFCNVASALESSYRVYLCPFQMMIGFILITITMHHMSATSLHLTENQLLYILVILFLFFFGGGGEGLLSVGIIMDSLYLKKGLSMVEFST